MTLLCIDCKHVKEEIQSVGPVPAWPFTSIGVPAITIYRCVRPGNRSHVTGEVVSVAAEEERGSLHQDSCGPNGKHWESKEEKESAT